ncbi:MAG: 1-deoxy-D-xylulose-5-phosphate reductoisomerase, partial [Natronospirillum sp.]
LSALTFEAPDPVRFPCLRLAAEAYAAGNSAPAVLNAANEVSVAAFLRNEIGFMDIARVNETILDRLSAPIAVDVDELMDIDARARREAEASVRQYSR